MEELNEMTVVDENEIATTSETDVVADTDVRYVDANVVFGLGMIGGALALKTGQVIWNSKPVTKVRNAAADGIEKFCDGIKSHGEERKRKKLAKLKNEVIDVEVIPEKDAVNE